MIDSSTHNFNVSMGFLVNTGVKTTENKNVIRYVLQDTRDYSAKFKDVLFIFRHTESSSGYSVSQNAIQLTIDNY